MKTKWIHLLSLIKYGDLGKLANEAKISPSILSGILNGKVSAEAYPQLPKILGDYAVKRTIELQGEFDAIKQTKEACEKLGLEPLTEEEILKKKLTRYRLSVMRSTKLLEVNEKLGLRINTQRSNEWGDRDWDDFAQKIGDKIGLKEQRK